MLLYHRVPAQMTGDRLFPLNVLKDTHPELYQRHCRKYQARPEALSRAIMPLNCLWNDVIHLTPIHPSVFKQALREAGQPESQLPRATWYELPIESLGLTSDNCTLFWSPTQQFGDWRAQADHYQPFDPSQLAQYAQIPPSTEAFYREQIAAGKNPLNFFRTPHVLFKGTITIDASTRMIED